MIICQSITGQLSKDTLRASHQQMAAQLFKKDDKETNISIVPLPGSHTAHTCMEAVLRGPEYQMELPNPKSPCLNLAGSDVLHYFVTRPLQNAFNAGLVLLYQLLKLLPNYQSCPRRELFFATLRVVELLSLRQSLQYWIWTVIYVK